MEPIQPRVCPGHFTIAVEEKLESVPLALIPGSWYGIDLENFDPCDQDN